MSRTYRIGVGKAAVTVTGDLEAMAKRLVDATAKAFVDATAPIADAVVASAEAHWYDDIEKRTGKSGQWTTAISLRPDSVTVGIQSLDDRKVGPNGAVVAFVVHRPGVLSLMPKEVSQGEWWRAKKAGHPVGRTGAAGANNWLIYVPNPDARDGKTLMPELIRRPFRQRIKNIGTQLGPIVSQMVRRAVA